MRITLVMVSVSDFIVKSFSFIQQHASFFKSRATYKSCWVQCASVQQAIPLVLQLIDFVTVQPL